MSTMGEKKQQHRRKVSKGNDILEKKRREMWKTLVAEVKSRVGRINSRSSRSENIRDGRQTKVKNYGQVSRKKILTKYAHGV